MATRDGRVLYVHPYNHVQDDLVPMGAVALLNRVQADKVGRYAYELTDGDIEQAAVLCMDLHWYFSVEAVRWIAEHAKRIRPDLPIVLGGITASFYAAELLERFPLDYVVQGDAEYTFPRLIEALVSGDTVPALPNLWRRGGGMPERRAVTPEEYAANDYLTLDWFPALARRTRSMHDLYAERPFWEEMDRYHPYIPLNRGCIFPCPTCFGAYQSSAFGNGQVDRSARALGAALDRIDEDPGLRFVTFTGGTESVERIGAYREVLEKRRALGAYVMHFCDLPTDAQLRMYLDAFDRVVIDFTNPVEIRMPLEASGWTTETAERRVEEILTMLDGEPRARVGLSSIHGDQTGFLARMGERAFETIRLKNAAEWALPAPTKVGLPMFRKANPRAQEAHRVAKGEQLDAFRKVSAWHANVALAYATAPALRPILNEPMPYDDHVADTGDVALDAPAAQTFRRAFRAAYERWYVTTLDRVVVRAIAATLPGDAPSGSGSEQRAPTRGWPARARDGWHDLGEMNDTRAMNGATLTLEVAWPGGDALVLAPTLWADEDVSFDLSADPAHELLTLPIGDGVAAGERVSLSVRATQQRVEMRVARTDAEPLVWGWSLDLFSPGGAEAGQTGEAVSAGTPIAAPLARKIATWVPRAMGAAWRLESAVERDARIEVSVAGPGEDRVRYWVQGRVSRGAKTALASHGVVEVYCAGELPAHLRDVGERMATVLARLLGKRGDRAGSGARAAAQRGSR